VWSRRASSRRRNGEGLQRRRHTVEAAAAAHELRHRHLTEASSGLESRCSSGSVASAAVRYLWQRSDGHHGAAVARPVCRHFQLTAAASTSHLPLAL